MTVALDDVLRVTALMSNATSGLIANVYHIRLSAMGNGTVSDAQAISDMRTFMDDLYAECLGSISLGVAFDGINIFNVTQDKPLGTYTWPTRTLGSGTGDALPSTVAGFVQLNTGYSRSWGRKFIGGMVEGHNTSSGKLDTYVLGQLADYAAFLLAGHVGGSSDFWEPVIYHAALGTWRYLEEGIIRDVWATIRRRRIGRGA